MAFGDRREGKEDEGRHLPDMVRRAVERSVNVLLQSDDDAKRLFGSLLPKELVQSVVQSATQAVDTTKREAVEIVAREMQQFLTTLNLSEEIRKVLTSVSFEIRTEVRFVPNPDGTLSSQIKSRAAPKRTATKSAPAKPKKKPVASKPKPNAKTKDATEHQGQRQESALSAVQDAVQDAMQDAMAGTRSRVRKVVDRIAEARADLASDDYDDED
jgi:hypothetical protein